MALPVDAKDLAAEGPPLSPCLPTTVLIVEDEPLVRMMAAEAFTDAGFVVRQAANGEEGLRLLVADRSIEALFTDINMPGRLDGFALAEAAGCSRPHLAIVITSGRLSRPGSLPEKVGFLAKPYSPDAAAALMRRLVERARAEAIARTQPVQERALETVCAPASSA